MTHASPCSPIHVLHVTYDMRIGGTEQVIKNLIQGANTETYSQSIFCLESPIGPWGTELLSKGIEVSGGNRSPKFDWSLVWRLRQTIKKRSIQIVHCHQYTPYIYGLIAAIGTSAKVVFTEHGRFYPDTSSWKRTLLNPLFARLTARITAISKATKQALVDYENFSQNDIEVIYNGISDIAIQNETEHTKAFKSKWRIPENDLVFGTVARLDPIKNQRMMIDAFGLCLKQNPCLSLVIIGDGELREELEQQVDKLGISSKVTFTGYMANPISALHAIDIFLLSSLSEGTSMTLLEAMCMGKPCVVTDAGGNPEIVEDSVTGYVTPNQDLQSFAKAMQTISISEDKAHQHLSQASRRRYESMFTEKIMRQRYYELYQQILS